MHAKQGKTVRVAHCISADPQMVLPRFPQALPSQILVTVTAEEEDFDERGTMMMVLLLENFELDFELPREQPYETIVQRLVTHFGMGQQTPRAHAGIGPQSVSCAQTRTMLDEDELREETPHIAAHCAMNIPPGFPNHVLSQEPLLQRKCWQLRICWHPPS